MRECERVPYFWPHGESDLNPQFACTAVRRWEQVDQKFVDQVQNAQVHQHPFAHPRCVFADAPQSRKSRLVHAGHPDGVDLQGDQDPLRCLVHAQSHGASSPLVMGELDGLQQIEQPPSGRPQGLRDNCNSRQAVNAFVSIAALSFPGSVQQPPEQIIDPNRFRHCHQVVQIGIGPQEVNQTGDIIPLPIRGLVGLAKPFELAEDRVLGGCDAELRCQPVP